MFLKNLAEGAKRRVVPFIVFFANRLFHTFPDINELSGSSVPVPSESCPSSK